MFQPFMETKVIAVVNQKGGCGKTTISMQLAGALGKDDCRVLVVDADPQGTATRWAANAEDDKPFPAAISGLGAAGGKVHREIKKYVGEYDYILIDCPPAVDSLAPQSALIISELALVPVIPSPSDLWAAVGIQELIERMQSINESLKARLVANMCQSNVSLNEAVLSVLKDFGVPKFDCSLCLRTAYSQSAVIGGNVFNIKAAGKAVNEIVAMKKEILAILKVKLVLKINIVNTIIIVYNYCTNEKKLSDSLRISLNEERESVKARNSSIESRLATAEEIFQEKDDDIDEKSLCSVKKRPLKVVRDTFSIPESDYLLLNKCKNRGIEFKCVVNKSEIVRAGLILLNKLPDEEFVKALKLVKKIKMGRPKTS